jgi:L-lactate dehydrogenase complex protein LldG
MDRDAFLARVRESAAVGRAYRVHLRPVPEHIGYLGVKEDLVERFAAEVDAVGGQSFIVPDIAAARTALFRLLEEAGARSALCWQHALLDRLGLAEALAAPGVAMHTFDTLAKLPPAEQRRLQLACDIGITSCDLAIAETGTLMLCSRPGQERLASLVPPYYVSIVERPQIVPDLIDAFDRLQSPALPLSPSPTLAPIPSNVTFITGPSKTGDIELQLTTGVHGPGKWRVIVID